MTTSIRNKHHNVPRSYGGSNDASNVVSIYSDTHTDFHRKFGHLTPDQLMRILIVSSAYEGAPKTFLTNFLNTAMQPDWRSMYDPHAIVSAEHSMDSDEQNDAPSHSYKRAAGYVDTAQQTLSDLNALFRNGSTGRIQEMDEQTRMRVTMGIADLSSIVDNYGKMLRSSYNKPASEGTTDIRISIHTSYQLLTEANATMSSVQALLGQGLSDDARQFKRSALHFFRANTGCDAVCSALSETNGRGHLLYTNPLLPHYRTRFLEQLHGVEYEKPSDTSRKEIIAVLNAHTRKLLGNILREHEIIDQHSDAM